MSDEARAVIDTVKAELPSVWLGGRQRMVLEDAIAAALTDAKALGLEEAAKLADDEMVDADATREESDIAYNCACRDICKVIRARAAAIREGRP
jgi:hypothetical protein